MHSRMSSWIEAAGMCRADDRRIRCAPYRALVRRLLDGGPHARDGADLELWRFRADLGPESIGLGEQHRSLCRLAVLERNDGQHRVAHGEDRGDLEVRIDAVAETPRGVVAMESERFGGGGSRVI